MIKKILLAIVVIVVAILGVASFQPDTYSVTRTATIAAPPAAVYAQVADFHKWEAWSPWEKLDPNMTRTHSGAPSGAGAKYGWVGNSDAGSGEMTILKAEPASLVEVDLHFIEPFESKALTTFALAPAGDGTEVTWSMRGDANLLTKVMCLFKSMDAMIGPDFERGLSQLKLVSEGTAVAGLQTRVQ